MSNEVVLLLMLIVTYGGTLIFYKFLGKSGLYAWTVVATVTANIEVMILIDAFGMEQTLGNVLFASTFLVTDILSEIYGKASANKAVKIGIFTNLAFIVISQSWFLYTPNANDWAMPSMQEIFANTPRLMIVGIVAYAIAQVFDVWCFHNIWEKTEQKFGNKKQGLWIRNNLSTLLSQLLNTVLFTFGAFYGVYDMETLMAICVSTYVVYFVIGILDTPAVYLARKILVDQESV